MNDSTIETNEAGNIPSLERYRGGIITLKYGGAAMSEEYSEGMFAADIATLHNAGIHPVIVHGGGSCVTDIATRLGIATTFVNGHRVTDEPMMEAVVMGLAGKVNKNIVRSMRVHGVDAIGLCGVDGGLLQADRLSADDDLGMVGEVKSVNVGLLQRLINAGMVPVIAPVGIGDAGLLYNINADLAASAVASALGAEELIYLSNVEGIAVDGEILTRVTECEARALIGQDIIHGGMLPKIFSAFDALAAGVKSVRIIDGRLPGILIETLTGIQHGTAIVGDE